jgi:hypothetical protein
LNAVAVPFGPLGICDLISHVRFSDNEAVVPCVGQLLLLETLDQTLQTVYKVIKTLQGFSQTSILEELSAVLQLLKWALV